MWLKKLQILQVLPALPVLRTIRARRRMLLIGPEALMAGADAVPAAAGPGAGAARATVRN